MIEHPCQPYQVFFCRTDRRGKRINLFRGLYLDCRFLCQVAGKSDYGYSFPGGCCLEGRLQHTGKLLGSSSHFIVKATIVE